MKQPLVSNTIEGALDGKVAHHALPFVELTLFSSIYGLKSKTKWQFVFLRTRTAFVSFHDVGKYPMVMQL